MASDPQIATELDAQYRTLREGAGLLERSSRGKLTISGSEGAEFLQGQLTNDIEALEPGDGCYAALLDRKGHMRADMRVLRLAADQIWIDTEPETIATAHRHLDMYRIGRDAEVADVGAERGILSLIGPRSIELIGNAPLGSEHRHAVRRIAEQDCVAVATDSGVDLISSSDGIPALIEALIDAGAEPIGEPAAELLRVESGRPRWGRELDERTIPQEAGLNERAVSFEKGCYVGQETVARLHYKGKPNRHLRRLRPGGPVEPGATVSLGDRQLGRIGTVALSPAQGRLALAILRREAEPGTEVTIESESGPIAASVEEIGA